MNQSIIIMFKKILAKVIIAIGLKLMHIYLMVMIFNMPSYSIFGEKDNIIKFWKYNIFWPVFKLELFSYFHVVNLFEPCEPKWLRVNF